MCTSVFMSCLSRCEEKKKTSAGVESRTHVLETAQEENSRERVKQSNDESEVWKPSAV